jgi:hypothetical protein
VNINRNVVDIDRRVYKWREETSILISSFLNHQLDLQLNTLTSQRNSIITLPTHNMLAISFSGGRDPRQPIKASAEALGTLMSMTQYAIALSRDSQH